MSGDAGRRRWIMEEETKRSPDRWRTRVERPQSVREGMSLLGRWRGFSAEYVRVERAVEKKKIKK